MFMLIELLLPALYLEGRGNMNAFLPAIHRPEQVVKRWVVRLHQNLWMRDIFVDTWLLKQRIPLLDVYSRGTVKGWSTEWEKQSIWPDAFEKEYSAWIQQARKDQK